MTHRILLAVALGALGPAGPAACTSPATTPAKPAAAQEPAKDPKAPLARWGGEVVTAGELEDLVKRDLRRMETEHQQQVYQLKRAALDSLVAKRLVEGKAKAAGKTGQELVQAEVVDKLAEPGDREIREVYDQAKAAGQQLPPLPQVRSDIVRFIRQRQAQQALAAYYERLRAEAKVEVLLPAWLPPRQEVAAEGPSRGPAGAPITIVEFSDYECPYCSKAEAVVSQVLETYGDKVRLVYRDFPLPGHPAAQKAAEAAHCAGDQGKFWDMHGKLFANQRALAPEALKGYAKDLALDAAKFAACLESGEKAAAVAAHKKAGDEAGVSGTPAFFVNGVQLSGAQPFERFKEVIDAELARR